jgi:2'-5' RNA ligase
LSVLAALDDAGAPGWLLGGWGVDALLGSERRVHEDVDIGVDPDTFDETRVRAALARLGFRLVDPEAPTATWTQRLLIFENDQGAGVDIILPAVSLEVGAGTVAGAPVRCLSPAAQLQVHRGYETQLRAVDHVDVAALCQRFGLERPPWLSPPAPLGPLTRPVRGVAAARRLILRAARGLGLPVMQSALVLPLPGVDEVIRTHRQNHGLPPLPLVAHITVLFPFAPPRRMTRQSLSELAAAEAPFAARLAWLGRFPGVLYLAPEPSEAFVALTRTAWSRWPYRPPYDGRFPTLVPHVTVAEGDWPPGLENDLAAVLPITAPIEELWLLSQRGKGPWEVAQRLPLSGS